MIVKSKSSLPLTLGAVGLLIAGGVTAYWAWHQRQGEQNLPVGVNIIPQDALLTASVSTAPNQWQQLREFGNAQTQAALERELVQLQNQFLTLHGYNYQQDIQPWVGKEVTLAVLAAKPNQGKLQPQSLLVVMPISNPVRAQQFFSQQVSGQGKEIKYTYKGVPIEALQGGGTNNYWATVLDRKFLVVGNTYQATQQAIDTYKGEVKNITTIPGYIAGMRKIAASQPFAQVYVNIPATATVTPGILPAQLAQLQENQGLATTISLQPKGMELQSISWLKPNSNEQHLVENQAGGMSNRLPANTLMMLSGGDLRQLWREYAASATNATLPLSPDNLRTGLNSLTGLDLERDVLNPLGGKFAVGLIPAVPKAGTPQSFAVSLVLMVQASDRSGAEKTFQQLDQIMQSKYHFQVQPAKIAGQAVVNWISPYGLTATHGWLDGDIAFLSVGAPIVEQFVPNPTSPLGEAAAFQAAVPSQPSPNNGQFYLDMTATLKAFPLLQLPPEQQIWLTAIRSIGVTTAVIDPRSIRYNALISIPRGER